MRPLIETIRSPLLNARRLCRTAGHDFDNLHGLIAQQIVLANKPPGQRSNRCDNSQRQPTNSAVCDQFADYPLGRFGGYGKSQSLGHCDNRRIYAYHSAARVQKRTARIARVKRRRVLNDILDQSASLAAHGPAQRADDSRGDRGLKSKRIAHGDYKLSDLQGFGVAQFGKRQIAGRNANQSQIGGRIVANQFRVERISLGRNGPKLASAVDHVAVRQRIAVGRQE